ncbi:MAG: MHYT domain-containing protein [Pseudomonadota bacterium]|nr:MHYT domain-containing protein [Pseudomonadota bacterium]
MITDYDLPLVLSSFLVAVLAAYTALYFGARLAGLAGGERWRWLSAGALLMGSGVWAMHFVGMRAMPMGVPMTFDVLMTAVSWLAAVAASGVALHIISRPQLGRGLFVVAAVSMGAGITVMHYLGMYAMRMSEAPMLHTGFLALSVAIAVGASGAALALCRTLQSKTGSGTLAYQGGAAVLMALAICGMHYTGMMAMMFPEGAVPAADNGLRGDWMGLPLAGLAAALMAFALAVTVMDLRQRRERLEQVAREQQRVAELAFRDLRTGLPNRAALEREILNELAQDASKAKRFALIHLDIANARSLSETLGETRFEEAMRGVAETLQAQMSEHAMLARYSVSAFFLLVKQPENAENAFMYRRLRQIDDRVQVAGATLRWRTGQSHYPTTGNSSRKLIRVAMVPHDPEQIGRFEQLQVAPELVMPDEKPAGETLTS